LLSVNRAKLAFGIGPFIPNGAAIFFQPSDIGFAAQEPQQFDDDRTRVQLLGCQKREAIGQVKAHLPTKNTQSARARAIFALLPIL